MLHVFLLAFLMQEPQAPPPPAPPPPKLTNEGKPMLHPYVCSEDDIQGFGLACSADEPCAVYLELADAEVVGNTILLTGNLHNDTMTFYSVLLLSEDLGKTWNEPIAPVKFGVIDQIQFIDFQNGWISGQVIQTIPRDPFFLVTSDGGKTWRRRPLFDDGRAGFIEKFWFDSKRTGALLLDRSKAGDPRVKYEYYESETGGDSWSLREVSSKPIQPKRIQPVPNLAWRLRADPAIKAYRLERRVGAAWQTAAQFTIRLKDCVPPPPPPPPPPAAEEPKPGIPR
jgi:hypothetical protein